MTMRPACFLNGGSWAYHRSPGSSAFTKQRGQQQEIRLVQRTRVLSATQQSGDKEGEEEKSIANKERQTVRRATHRGEEWKRGIRRAERG